MVIIPKFQHEKHINIWWDIIFFIHERHGMAIIHKFQHEKTHVDVLILWHTQDGVREVVSIPGKAIVWSICNLPNFNVMCYVNIGT